MNILAYVHGYPPVHNAGAEHMLHALLREMVRRGHAARVVTGRGKLGTFAGELDGVDVRSADAIGGNEAGEADLGDSAQWADVVISHLDWTRRAIDLARLSGKPLVYLVHNTRSIGYFRVMPREVDVMVFNSYWLARRAAWPGLQAVVRPPVEAGAYRVQNRWKTGAITLINLTEDKGAHTFYALARMMPDRPFLAVEGAYGDQIIPDGALPLNVQVLTHQVDAREIYRRTRILLMPSRIETWGRTAVEAAASGIPTIAHPTEGLQESLSYAGVFCDRSDTAGWARAVEAMDDDPTYRERSALARRRAAELDPTEDFNRFEEALLVACNGCGKKSGEVAAVTRGPAPLTAAEQDELSRPVRMRALHKWGCEAYEGELRKDQEFTTPEWRARKHERDGRAVRIGLVDPTVVGSEEAATENA